MCGGGVRKGKVRSRRVSGGRFGGKKHWARVQGMPGRVIVEKYLQSGPENPYFSLTLLFHFSIFPSITIAITLSSHPYSLFPIHHSRPTFELYPACKLHCINVYVCALYRHAVYKTCTASDARSCSGAW